jgi:PucR family transcriptional regulator, purine catabolism regulatory protein
MENVAKTTSSGRRDLPARSGYSVSVADLFSLPSFAGAELVAGAGGRERSVSRVNVIEVPDILPWVKPDEMLLTTGFPLRNADTGAVFGPKELVGFVESLAARRAAALAVKAGRYLDELPPQMLAAADRLRFPLIWLPRAVAFDDVMSEVFAQLVDRQSSALDLADRLHRALSTIVLEGGDLPQLAEEIAALFEVAVLICTADGRVQTTAGPQDPLRDLPLFDPSGRFMTERVVAGSQRAPAGHPGRLVVARIAAGDTDHGRIVAYAANRDHGPVAVQALERAATVAALAITKKLAVAAVESKFRGDFLRDALAGAAGTADQVADHCAGLGWDVRRPLVVAVAQLDDVEPATPTLVGRTPLDRLTSAWQQVVHARDSAAPVVGFGQEVVALVPATPDTAQAVVADIVAAVAGDRGGGRRAFSTGVSRVIDSVEQLATAYDQARKAVVVGRRTRGPSSVAHFDTLGVHRLLSLVSDSAELRSFAAEILGRLVQETPEADDLRRTLQTLLDTNCNVAETARLLHFHYNTLRYRIGKLESIVGPFTTDPNLRLDVALALRVVQMRGL